MKKILLSSVVVVAAAAVVVGATTAFFSDTETSTGNVFTAGSIDLKVDSDCHYYNYVQTGVDSEGQPVFGYVDVGCGTWVPNPEGTPEPVAVGVWEENDLGAIHRFFSFGDLKPGDWGEDTISLHVYDNDAWGLWNFNQQWNDENGCTEPELEDEVNCADDDVDVLDDAVDDGELLGWMGFEMWLDQGSTPGFQNVDSEGNRIDGDPDFDAAGEPIPDAELGIQPVDPWEGDNVWQNDYEPAVRLGTSMDLRNVLSGAWDEDCDNSDYNEDGHNNYGTCQGLAEDGRLVGSTTYYFGFKWSFDEDADNEVQTDSLGGDISFEVEQHRNNPSPSWD